ncbi:MAG: hypothetical protein MJZ76_10305 [Bacteroidales bacterium]|nr:hypothetical protein [Bacteroidales bacterium]
MNKNETRILDLYKGFEGENGFFFALKDKVGKTLQTIKAWSGYVGNIVYENPHVSDDGWHGLTKLFHEDIINDIDYPLDNYFKVKDEKDFFDDLMWYKENRYEEFDKETKNLLDGLIEMSKSALINSLEMYIACDEE